MKGERLKRDKILDKEVKPRLFARGNGTEEEEMKSDWLRLAGLAEVLRAKKGENEMKNRKPAPFSDAGGRCEVSGPNERWYVDLEILFRGEHIIGGNDETFKIFDAHWLGEVGTSVGTRVGNCIRIDPNRK